jgi:hypothetical protein
MEPATIITHLVAGGLLGMLGQGVRVVAGIKKANDEAAAQGKELKEVFQLNKLLVSLFIGFTAGALSLLVAASGEPAIAAANAAAAAPGPFTLDRNALLAVIGAGYAGTDFIEAFMRKQLPTAAPQQEQGATASQVGKNLHDEPPAVG